MSKDDEDFDDGLAPGDEPAPTWLEQLAHYTGAVASGALTAAKFPAVLTEMFGESWLKDVLFKSIDTERLMAMVEAGRLFKDARQVAGLTVKDMADALGMSDEATLNAVEEGKAVLPFEMIFRSASLVARHDPVPFIIQLMRSYNPRWGKTLGKWGVSALPKQFERERRFINVYRKHDQLRQLSDEEYARLITYVDSATTLVLDVMNSEKAANSKPEETPE